MKKICTLFALSLLTNWTFGQLNMNLTDQIDYTQAVSSLWGYIDPEDSTEYAAVGTATGLSVVNLTDPANVVETAFVPDVNSQWREVKSYGHYIYAVTEGGGGVLVVNMTDPANVTSTHWAPNIPGLGTLGSIHSISVDEFGYLYLNGSNLNSGGVLIADVSADDGTPVYAGHAPAVYCHDSYARNNILYTSDIYDGEFKVYDVSDKSDIQLISTQGTPYAFTHNTWLNDAGTVIFTTDEKANAPVGVYDISDLDNIVELDQFRPVSTLGQGVIPHNVHVWNDWVITAYYTDGTLIIDGSRPENMIEVGYFDSFVSQSAGFFGVWGVYPYFPSGLVIASDIQNGLLVYEVDYVRACWLEGTVTDAVTSLAISNANVHIESAQANAGQTDLNGEYKTGQAIPGTFDVVFSATGYISKTVQATLDNGVLTILDVQLEPLSSFVVTGQAVKTDGGAPVPNAVVTLQNEESTFTVTADANGNFSFPGVFGGDYTLVAGGWGYLAEAVENFSINDNTQPILVTLDEGYQDDFVLNLGWTTAHTSTTGWWVRAEPIGTTYNNGQSNPELDIEGDLGDQAYITGNGGGAAADDDVDNGSVTLTSPPMDLTGYAQPVLHYHTWFFNGGGSGQPNDNLRVSLTNGTQTIVLETITQSNAAWNPEASFDLTGLLPLTSTVQIIFETSDLQASGHLVEAGVDAFSVEELSLYPPFSASATSGCAPFVLNFTDNSDSTVVWNWAFEGADETTSSEQNPSVTYSVPGTFSVSLTATTASGNIYTVNRPNLIEVNIEPTASFDYTVTGSTVNFNNTSLGGGNYTWAFGDNATGTQVNPSHTYQQADTYTVTLSVVNDCGTSTSTQEVEILTIAPTASFGASATSGCAPFTVQFSDQSTGNPTGWAWTFIGGTPATSSVQNPVVVYSTPGTFSVQLTASNAAGSNQASQSQLIEVGQAPSINFTFAVQGGSVTFGNNSVGASSYAWNFGDNSATSTEANPVHSYAATGEYEVTLTATNACGSAVFTETVTVVVSSTADLDEKLYSLTATPNPFSESLTVSFGLAAIAGPAELLIFNVFGQQTGRVTLEGKQGQVRLASELPASGVYFLRLAANGRLGRALRVVRF